MPPFKSLVYEKHGAGLILGAGQEPIRAESTAGYLRKALTATWT